MKTTFEQARAMFGSDAQMARALFDQLAIVRLDLKLQQALRRRAEDRVRAYDSMTNITIKEGRTR